ncbi:hypothetical protein J4442_02390 [Candidatus Woesearchaeota archaeon]|nr:hypothetical protein [Candidatus Woesearchaeota archaeon]
MVNLSSVIKGMKDKGIDNSSIIDELKNRGHSSRDIYDSLDKDGEQYSSDLEPPSPNERSSIPNSQQMDNKEQEWMNSPEEDRMMGPPLSDNAPQQIPQRQNIEQIEEIAEAIVEEKLQEFSSSIGDINIWKERVNSEIGAIKQEVIRIRNQLENLQIGMLGKVEGYNKSVQTMSSEMKALSKVMEKIIEPLSTNVKELSRITEKFKGIKG